jgi:hypothetical protein
MPYLDGADVVDDGDLVDDIDLDAGAVAEHIKYKVNQNRQKIPKSRKFAKSILNHFQNFCESILERM